MLMPLQDLVARWSLTIHGVLHVGAHLGEEAEAYDQCGISNVWWVEGNWDLLAPLKAHVEPFGHNVVHGLVTDRDGQKVKFHLANNGQSSSVLEFGTHRRVSPDVHYVDSREVVSVTVDTLVARHGIRDCNFLNMDIQGAELLALRGARRTLASVDYLYLEINEDHLYKGCALLSELVEFLGGHGFRLAEKTMAGDQKRGGRNWTGWGDGVFIRA